ncbi:Dim1 family - like 3 [Theobroma cacao]|nr:Dim1 family - like 3 [Theobroma cacao]
MGLHDENRKDNDLIVTLLFHEKPSPSPTVNKHIMIDLGTGNNKINWALKDKQEFISIVDTIYHGARKGRGLMLKRTMSFEVCRGNKHIMIDLGTGNNKINWALKDKQEFISIVDTIYHGARKGRGLMLKRTMSFEVCRGCCT